MLGTVTRTGGVALLSLSWVEEVVLASPSRRLSYHPTHCSGHTAFPDLNVPPASLSPLSGPLRPWALGSLTLH